MTNVSTLNAAVDKKRSRTWICRKDQTVELQNSVVWTDWKSDNFIGINCWFSFCQNNTGASILLWNVAVIDLILSCYVSLIRFDSEILLLEYLAVILEISFCDLLFCSWFNKTTKKQPEASCSAWQNYERHETSSKNGRRISEIRGRFFTKTNKERVTKIIIITTTHVQTPELMLMQWIGWTDPVILLNRSNQPNSCWKSVYGRDWFCILPATNWGHIPPPSGCSWFCPPEYKAKLSSEPR